MPKPDEHRVTIRFTGEEYAVLMAKAGGQAMAPYIRDLLLQRVSDRWAKPLRNPVKDHIALAKMLAKLGTSPMVHDFRNVTKQTRNGTLPTSEDAETRLAELAVELTTIKTLLMIALDTVEQ